MSIEQTEVAQLENIPTPDNGAVNRYHMAARKALAVVALAATVGVGGCGAAGGSSKSIDGEYLYVGQGGAIVEYFDFVRNGSHLTGNVETLVPVTSDQAEFSPDILDATGKPLPGTQPNAPVVDPKTNEYVAPSDNAACGGTPMCFQDVRGTVNGRLGANGRISLSDVTDLTPTPITDVGELQGDGFTLNGAEFKPSDSKAIAVARSKAPMFLRTVSIPAEVVHEEISALQKPVADMLTNTTWDQQLADDVSALQDDANVDPMNQLGCDYSDVVTYDINNMQSDVSAENAEIAKAQKLIGSLKPAARQQARGDIAKVRAEISARQADISKEVDQANASISKANAEEPKIETFLQKAECGAIHLAAHALLEAGE